MSLSIDIHTNLYPESLFLDFCDGYDDNSVFSCTDTFATLFSIDLGNIRLKYTTHPQTGEISILEENHYYPYGLIHIGYSDDHDTVAIGLEGRITLMAVTSNVRDPYKYKFGGMEYQDEFDVNIYDFGARNYDPALGRWMNIDPLAEIMRRHSPYNYAFDNPIIWTDPDGMSPIMINTGYREQSLSSMTGSVEYSGTFDVAPGGDKESNGNGRKQIRNTFKYDDKGQTKGTDKIQQTESSTTEVKSPSGKTVQKIESTTITTAYVDAEGNVKKDVYKSTNSHIYSKKTDGTWSRSDPIDEHIKTVLEETGSDFQSYVNEVSDFKKSEKISPIQSYGREIEQKKNIGGYVSFITGVIATLAPEPTVTKGFGFTSVASGSSILLRSNPEKIKFVKNLR